MTRWKIITGAVLLACIAAVLPPAALYFLSRARSVELEQRHLEEYAAWTVMRANITLRDAASALHDVENDPEKSCSRHHITDMRLAVMAHRAIAEVGLYQKGRLTCTSWGPVDTSVPKVPVDYTTHEGIGVHVIVHPKINPGHNMIGLEYGMHNVLVEPEQMVDVLVDNEMALAIANEKGRVIATLNQPDIAVVRQAIQNPGRGATDKYLYATYRSPNWIAVAIEKRSYSNASFRHLRLYMLPLGIVLAAIMVCVVLWAVRRRLSPLTDLQHAIRQREFIAYYQPIIDLHTGRCVGAEALARWKRPDGTLIVPNLFIPLAEQSGLICPITDIIIERVLEDMQNHLRINPDFYISINLCAADAVSGRPLQLLEETLRCYGIPPQQIMLEVTERAFIRPEEARRVLATAREQGHSLAIDDFGTGYSSLALLHSLPLDTLKIDKSFVDAIGTDSASAAVVPHIIGMANTLGLRMIAEGVEREEQAEYLRQRDVGYGQGWLYGKPMKCRDFLRYYRSAATEREPVRV